jgi:putative flippase GtrA
MLKLPTFTLVSGVGWCLDFLIFNGLVALGISYFVSNLCSAAVAVTFVLITARRFIFRNHAERLRVVVAKYVVWNILAVAAASFLISLVANGLESSQIATLVFAIVEVDPSRGETTALVANLAKLLITPLTMYANFLMASYIIERRFSFY